MRMCILPKDNHWPVPIEESQGVPSLRRQHMSTHPKDNHQHGPIGEFLGVHPLRR
ncbi:MAG: hypothetical protein OWS74_07605 [Firmicutes bacterium]|nr:hypothetical protein [Bacillota bacterium]